MGTGWKDTVLTALAEFGKNFAALLKVKTLVTLVVLTVFAVLAFRGDFEPTVTMGVITTVIAFYFGTQHEKQDGPKG